MKKYFENPNASIDYFFRWNGVERVLREAVHDIENFHGWTKESRVGRRDLCEKGMGRGVSMPQIYKKMKKCLYLFTRIFIS